jgi:hypothetical protein
MTITRSPHPMAVKCRSWRVGFLQVLQYALFVCVLCMVRIFHNSLAKSATVCNGKRWGIRGHAALAHACRLCFVSETCTGMASQNLPAVFSSTVTPLFTTHFYQILTSSE